MLMAGDTNLPTAQRLQLSYEGAERGLIDDSGLGALYIAIAKQNEPVTPSVEPPSTLESRYVLALKTESEGSLRNGIVANLLETQSGSVTPLLPFAAWVPVLNPGNLSARAVRNGLMLMLKDGTTPPLRWVNAWLKSESGDSAKSNENLALYLANLVPENLPTESAVFADTEVKKVFVPAESPETLEIYGFFLDSGARMHYITTCLKMLMKNILT